MGIQDRDYWWERHELGAPKRPQRPRRRVVIPTWFRITLVLMFWFWFAVDHLVSRHSRQAGDRGGTPQVSEAAVDQAKPAAAMPER